MNVTQCAICSSTNIEDITSRYHKAKICLDCGDYSFEYLNTCCTEPNLVFVKYPIEGGGLQLRKACRNCYSLAGKNYKHSEVPDIHALKPYLNDYREKRDKEYNESRQKIVDKATVIRSKRREDDYELYTDYINNSELWKAKRKLALKRDNYICQGCLERPATDVHHITYKHLFNEYLFELISLCRDCHASYHNKMENKNEAA